jgi:hypothetical protein
MDKILKNYRVGIIVFSVLLLLTYTNRLVKSNKETVSKTVTLKSDPKYDYKTYKGTSYWIDMNFYEIADKLVIQGVYYQYLNHPKFLKEILKDTTVTIIFSNDNIIQISKNGFDYLEPEASKIHWEQNANFARILFLTALLTYLIPYLFRHKIGEKRFLALTKKIGLFIISIVVIVGLCASWFFDNNILNSDWTKYPLEKRR